jgi:multicomponent Na+:H+ antiporter subunit E
LVSDLGELAAAAAGQELRAASRPGQVCIAVAGADVARRALDPRLPVYPGFVLYPVGLPRGVARNTFTSLMSLLPGTVPTRLDNTGALLIHCLDMTQPVAAQLADEEALFARVIGKARANG